MAKDKTVGYKRPPQHTRFKPGQSGNPRGRPKGRLNMKTIIEKSYSEKVTIKTQGGLKRVTGADFVQLKLREQVGRGDFRAIKLSLEQLAAIYPDRDEVKEDSTAEDAELLESYVRLIIERQRRITGKKDE